MGRGNGITKQNGSYWIRYTDANGGRHFEKGGTKASAEKLLTTRRSEKLEGKLPETLRGSGITFDQLCDDALAFSKAQNSKKQTKELTYRIDNHLRGDFGTRPARTITKSEIIAWLADKQEDNDWSVATRNRWQATFSLIFRVAVDNEKLSSNPAKMKRKKEDNGRTRFLSEAEERKLLAIIDKRFPKYRPHLILSLNTGMRQTEQYSLKWHQVDLDKRLIYLEKTKNDTPRQVPLNDASIEALNAIKGNRDVKLTDPVFPSARQDDNGSLQGARGWFPSAVEEAELVNYTWHCNRHTFASRLVMAGVDLRTVAELLGHKTLQMVMRYSHLAETHKADAVNRLAAYAKAS
jgi:integrase